MDTSHPLFQVLYNEAFQTGDFTLSSGEKSDFYMDARKAQMHQSGAFHIGEAIYEQVCDLDIQAVGGMAVGAVSMVTSVLLSFASRDREIRGFWVREKKKGHGTQKSVEGLLKSGDNVLIVDDVITSGNSVKKSIEEAERCGAKVVRVIALVDRNAGGRELLSDYDYQPLFNIDQFLEYAKQTA